MCFQGPGFKATGVSRQDPGETANAGIYSVQAYDGLEIDVVRAVRLWYVPSAAELAVDLRPEEGESLIGVDISRTDEVRVTLNFPVPRCICACSPSRSQFALPWMSGLLSHFINS